MENHNGKVFGITFGVVGGVLLGSFVHVVLWGLLPLGICLGFLIDSKKSVKQKNSSNMTE